MSTSATPSASTAPSGPPTDSAPVVTPAKRKYDEVLAALGDMAPATGGKGKKAKRDSMDLKTPLEKLRSMAKYFVRAVHPFLDIGLVMFYGSQARWAAPVSATASNTVSIPASELAVQQCHIDAFEKMLAIAPDCGDILREFYKDNDQWGRIVREFRTAGASARHGDTNGLKHKLHYLPSDPATSIVPPVPETESKSDRGVNHPMLRDAIIPWKLRLKIHDRIDGEGSALTPGAEATLKALLNGSRTTDNKPALTAKRYPSCFWADNAYDPDAPEVGLLRSPFLLRIARHLWTSPGSAMNGAVALKKVCNARAHGQYVMIPTMLGYVCCQARTMISTSDWTIKDGPYKYEKLFDSIVKLFDDPADPWVVETLEWYQKGVFGSATAGGASDTDDSGDEDSEMASILARRAARPSPASTSSSSSG